MSRPLSWSWLCSRLSVAKKGGHVRTRPCLAALEQLEDRVLLASTLGAAPLIPLSNQSLNAVDAFLKIENSFEISQVDGIKLEADALNGNANLPAAVVDYFLKIDHDMVQIDNDFIGSPATATAAATTGIDGTLTNLALPVGTTIGLEAQLIPSVQSAREATEAMINKLQSGTAAVIRPAAAVDFFLKIEGIEGEAADDAAIRFGKIEWQFIGADSNDLGPALGPQGSAAPGAAGGLLQDLAVLTADVAPAGDLNGDGQADAFIKIENTFIQGENAFLGAEGAYLRKKLPGKMKSGQITLTAGAADYFLKLDADLIQVNTDLAGSAAGTSAGGPGGVDGVLLNDAQTLGLSQQTLSNLNVLVKTVQGASAEAATLEQEILGVPSGTTFQPGLIDTKHKGEIDIESWSWGLELAGMENNLIKLDPNLGPALGFQGSTTTPGPAGGLLQDSLALGADAGGTFPGAMVYPPPAVVDAFLKLEGTIIQDQNALVAAENAFLKLNVQLPQVIVDFFTNADNDVLEIDSGLLGSPGGEGTPAIPGIDDILVGLNGMPAAYVSQIQSLAKQVQSGQAALTKDAAAVQNTSGTVTPQALAFMESATEVIEFKFETASAAVSLNFAQIETQFIGLDPSDAALVQDSKNIADGAAKSTAVE